MTPAAGPRLLGPAEVRLLAERLDLRPTKQRGQNFVIDANTVRRIVRESGITGADVVVEVGPGLGSLTLALLEVARPGGRDRGRRRARRRCCRRPSPTYAPRPRRPVRASCRRRAAGHRAARAAADRAGRQPALQRLRAGAAAPAGAAAVARARPGDGAVRGRRPAGRPARARKMYGVPSVKAAWYADVRRAGAIGRNVFWPAPNVDSGLVAWTRRDPPATTASREQVFAVVDAAFAQRRKALRGALRGTGGLGRGRRGRAGRRRRRPAGAGRVARPSSSSSGSPEALDRDASRVPSAREDQPAASAWAPRAPTASTRSTPSTRRSASTTTSP